MGTESKSLKSYICKESTQQEEYRKKYPEYDGRGILVAIIDVTVADFSLKGMQKTTTGFRKIVDCFDFSSKRLINISTVKKVDSENTIFGLSGLKLKIPLEWKNPSGNWYLGLFKYHTLFFKDTYKSLNENEEFQSAWKNRKEVEGAKIFQQITETLSSHVDCIVWFDGEKWKCCIDTSFSKDLGSIKILTNYQDNEKEYRFLWNKIPFCIKIHNERNQLEIISPFYTRINKKAPSYITDHGTIVTHIAAGHFPEKPKNDGISPGAQIISMCHSNSIVSEKKALLKCIEMKVDVVNFSVKLLESPEIRKIIKEMVEKYGIIFVTSAKNDGPLYTSIQNEYRFIHDNMIVVGSIFTAEMKKKFYKFENNDFPNVYYYSSKGILDTGARGVDFVAPGAVITAVPKWYKNKNQYSTGTSVAAPFVTGQIACLLSALKANSIPYSPELIKFVLSKTAFLPKNCSKLEFGNGIIQINAAFEYFKNYAKILPKIILPNPKITFNETKQKKSLISLLNFKDNKKGIIFLKTESENISKEFCVTLNAKKCKEIQWILKIEPDSAKKFIEYSENTINNKFYVKINTNNLQNGSINYAEIHGFDVSNSDIGSLFYFPITIIVPEIFNENSIEKLISLNLNQAYNLFFISPEKSKQCTIKVTNLNEKQNYLFVKFADINRIFVSDKEQLNFTTEKNVCNCYFPAKERKIYEVSFYQTRFTETQMYKMEICFDQIVTEQNKNTNNQKKRKCKFLTFFDKIFFNFRTTWISWFSCFTKQNIPN